MKNRFFNKKNILMLIAMLIVFLGFTFLKTSINHSNQSPFEFLKKNIFEPIISPTEFLCQAEIGNKKYVVFYINGNSNVACAIIRKGDLSYSILGTSAELMLKNDIESRGALWNPYGDNNEWINWGIILNEEIDKVIIDGKEATIMNTTQREVRICFLSGKADYNDDCFEVIYKNGKHQLF